MRPKWSRNRCLRKSTSTKRYWFEKCKDCFSLSIVICIYSIDELDSYMYQSVGHEIIDLFAKAMELPLYRAEIKGNAQTTEKDYEQPVDGDEVEDLYELLSQIKVN